MTRAKLQKVDEGRPADKRNYINQLPDELLLKVRANGQQKCAEQGLLPRRKPGPGPSHVLNPSVRAVEAIMGGRGPQSAGEQSPSVP